MTIAEPRVLIIDDDEVVRSKLAERLRSEGVVVDVAASPEQALELLKINQYLVVSTDIHHVNSPISGDQFILQNREQFKEANVMILTAKQRTTIERFPELDKLNIPIFDKGISADQLRFVDLIKQKLNLPTAEQAPAVPADPVQVPTNSKPEDSSPNVPAGFELIHTIDENTGWIGQLSWSPDGTKLAAHTSQKGVLLWTRENKNAEIIGSSTNPTGGLAWSPDGNTLAYTSRSNVQLFDTVKMEAQGFIDDKDSDDQLSPGLAWSPDGKSLAIGNRGGKINIFSPEVRSLIKSLKASKDWTFALAWSPDSSLLAGGGDDNT